MLTSEGYLIAHLPTVHYTPLLRILNVRQFEFGIRTLLRIIIIIRMLLRVSSTQIHPLPLFRPPACLAVRGFPNFPTQYRGCRGSYINQPRISSERSVASQSWVDHRKDTRKHNQQPDIYPNPPSNLPVNSCQLIISSFTRNSRLSILHIVSLRAVTGQSSIRLPCGVRAQ